MRLPGFSTGTKILGAFALVSLAIVIISVVALWRMHAADATTSDLVNNKLARQQLMSDLLGITPATPVEESDHVEESMRAVAGRVRCDGQAPQGAVRARADARAGVLRRTGRPHVRAR